MTAKAETVQPRRSTEGRARALLVSAATDLLSSGRTEREHQDITDLADVGFGTLQPLLNQGGLAAAIAETLDGWSHFGSRQPPVLPTREIFARSFPAGRPSSAVRSTMAQLVLNAGAQVLVTNPRPAARCS